MYKCTHTKPKGIYDPRRWLLELDEDFTSGVRRFAPNFPDQAIEYFEETFTIHNIQLWGLGGKEVWDSQQEIRRRADRIAMQRRVTSLPTAEEWEADKWVLEMGGVKVCLLYS